MKSYLRSGRPSRADVRGAAGEGTARRGRPRLAGAAGEGAGGHGVGGQGRRACGRSGSRAGYISAPAAPQIRARHCRAMVGGVAGPATSAAPRPAHATSALCRATMHGATQAFGRARTIGVAKSVSFF